MSEAGIAPPKHPARALRGRLALLACMCAAAVFTGCASSGGDTRGRQRSDSWPFARSIHDEHLEETRDDTLAPIITEKKADEGSKSAGRTETTIRPFYSYVRDPVKEREESIALWPLFQSKTSRRSYGDPDDRTRQSQVWLMPFFYYNYFSSAPGEWEEDWYAPFPLVIGGDSSRDGPSFAVLPFGGTLKGLFGVDEINFAGGPLYVHLREGETNTWYFPWPLVRYGEGPNYSSAAVLPFYAHSRQEGSYERTSVAWPLVSWGEDGLSTRWPRKYWTAFPFAARSWTEAQDLVSILPPFFNFGYSKPTDTTVVDAPWPIFRYASGQRYEEFRLWPLYSQMRLDDDWTYNIAWPFIWHFDEKDPQWRESRTWILPFYTSRHRVYNPEADGTVREMSSVHGWPLFSYRSDVDESWRAQFPSPLPALGEKFDRLYGELFKIVALEGGPDRTSVEVLWGMLRASDDKYQASWALNPLMQYAREKGANPGPHGLSEQDRERFGLLGGLIGHEKTPEKTRVNFLWLFGADYD